MINPSNVSTARLEGLDASHQPEDQYDQKDEAQAAAWIVAPAWAVRPRWERAEQEEEQDNY